MNKNRFKSFKNLLMMCLFFFTPMTFAAEDMQRFNVWIDILEKSLSNAADGATAVKNLQNDPRARIAAFNVQALGKLYENIDPDFAIAKIEFQKIEDGLGLIDKWEKIKNKKNKKQATKDFANLLEKENWIKAGAESRISIIKSKLEKQIAKLQESDSDLLRLLVDQLHKIEKTDFNFSILEKGNGLHEYRRQIRWFMIEAQVLNGLLTFQADRNSCPLKEFEPLISLPIAESKYSQLNKNDQLKVTCEVSPCLIYALSDAVEKLGQIKDKAEKAIGNTKSDKTPKALAKDAEQVYRLIDSTRLLNILSKEIKSCL